MTGVMRSVYGKEVSREKPRHEYYVNINVNLNELRHECMMWVRWPKIGCCKESCEHGNEPLVSIKDRDFLDKLSCF
jgi:hypothetical protein